ncbi:MAG: hypothetical protein EOP35_05365 [Rubrivivax sp.]|nr:MAG: hypothetical protein EOP35_05365 [Rubrivivax sp.]
MLQTVLATIGLAICIAMALHMVMPRRAQARVDAMLDGIGTWMRAQIDRATGWRRRQRQTRAAALEAERAILRARQSSSRDRPEGEWDGNVYRPKSFDKPKKPH